MYLLAKVRVVVVDWRSPWKAFEHSLNSYIRKKCLGDLTQPGVSLGKKAGHCELLNRFESTSGEHSWPSVLWRCWLGVRKGIWPVKILTWLEVGAGVVIFWSKVQIACIWFSWCYCHLVVSASAKSRIVYPTHLGSPGQGLKTVVVVVVPVSIVLFMIVFCRQLQAVRAVVMNLTSRW